MRACFPGVAPSTYTLSTLNGSNQLSGPCSWWPIHSTRAPGPKRPSLPALIRIGTSLPRSVSASWFGQTIAESRLLRDDCIIIDGVDARLLQVRCEDGLRTRARAAEELPVRGRRGEQSGMRTSGTGVAACEPRNSTIRGGEGYRGWPDDSQCRRTLNGPTIPGALVRPRDRIRCEDDIARTMRSPNRP